MCGPPAENLTDDEIKVLQKKNEWENKSPLYRVVRTLQGRAWEDEGKSEEDIKERKLSEKLENLLHKLEEKGVKCNQIFDENLVKEIWEEADGFFCMKDNGKIEDMCAKGSSAFYMCFGDYLRKKFGKSNTKTALEFIESISKHY